MKKRLFLMAMAGVALAGCVNDEVADVVKGQEKVKIAFDSPVIYANSDSRANHYGEIGNPNNTTNNAHIYPTNENFVVFGVRHTGDFTGWNGAKEIFMGTATEDETDGNTLSAGEIAVYNSTLEGWETAQDYYWPGGGDKLTFAAYSPADLKAYATTGASATDETGAPIPTITYGSTGLYIQNFKVPNNIAAHFDLMFSKRAYNQTINGTNGTYNGVPLVFQHALSSIKFELQTTSTRTITLKRLEIRNVRSQGDFRESIHDRDNDIDTYQATPMWENFTKAQDFVVNAGNENVTFKGTNHNNFHRDILMLPQNLNKYTLNSVEETPQLYVEFAIDENTITEKRTIDLYNLPYQKVESASGTATAADPETISAWEMGVRYVYLLHYGDDKILFAPSAENWDEVKYIYVDLGKETSSTGATE